MHDAADLLTGQLHCDDRKRCDHAPGHLYATGRLRDGKLVLHDTRPLRAGHYTLKLTTGSANNRHTTSQPLTVDWPSPLSDSNR